MYLFNVSLFKLTFTWQAFHSVSGFVCSKLFNLTFRNMILHIFLFTAKSSAFLQPISTITAVNSCSSMLIPSLVGCTSRSPPMFSGPLKKALVILCLAH